MKYKLASLPLFDKALKRLTRKFPSLKQEITDLLDSLEINPTQGTALSDSCYKIRLAIYSKGRGKSGGGRVITHVVVAETTAYLLFIYDKSERGDISDTELRALLELIN